MGLLAPHLTPDNHRNVLRAAQHKSKRDVEHLIAALQPQPDVAASVLKLPTPKLNSGSTAIMPRNDETCPLARSAQLGPPAHSAPARPAVLRPLAPERYTVQFTVGKETYDKLRRLQDLMRHGVPNGDPAVIFDRALNVLLAELERRKVATVKRPRNTGRTSSTSRHIPAAVKRAVWGRDGGRCAFVGTNGRCAERGFLEFHHVVPYAEGGETSVETWSCAAARTTRTRPRSTSGRGNRSCCASIVVRRSNSVRTEFTQPSARP